MSFQQMVEKKRLKKQAEQQAEADAILRRLREEQQRWRDKGLLPKKRDPTRKTER
jgi:hypothetical protein